MQRLAVGVRPAVAVALLAKAFSTCAKSMVSKTLTSLMLSPNMSISIKYDMIYCLQYDNNNGVQ